MRILMTLIMVIAVTVAVADKAASFSLQDTQGNKVKLGDVLATKGCVMIDFWELSCFSCKQALPKYQQIYDKYKTQGFEVLAISVDSVRTASNVAPYAAGSGLTFPVLLDTNNDVFRNYHVEVMPTSFLIDCTGEIRFTHAGFKPGDEKEIEEKIVEVLKDYAGQKK
jgi:cytochrome c biogenesis protein CcmG, thiol:disulfide interchange protein DsbE